MIFRKALAKYYIKWFFDCHDSAIYCRETLANENRRRYYLDLASAYLTIIMENWEAIEFFTDGDKAFIREECIPKKFRGYL